MERASVVIVGAGQAAASVSARLRSNGHQGSVLILGDEPHLPYQRPPLSKKFLGGEWSADRLNIKPDTFWKSIDVEVRAGVRVDEIDVGRRQLIAGNEVVPWDRMVLATGSKARPQPPGFTGRTNVFELRSVADVERLRPHFAASRHLLVLGGGFIGLETAAVARRAGMEVTVIERAERILERAVCARTSDFIRDLHRRNGVRILEGRSVVETTSDTQVRKVVLDDGEAIEADFVLMGIGVLAETALAKAAGLAVGDGIIVDARGRTSAQNIWAAGDCTAFPYRGELVRLENVQNAIEQAETVADDICGRPAFYNPLPWFWSDQYDSKLQIVGLSRRYDDVVTRMSERGGYSSWYFDRGRLVAVDSVDDARAYMTGKKLLESGASVDKASVADKAVDLRSLLTS